MPDQTRAPDLADVLDGAGIGVWRWDPREGRVLWDGATRAIFGVDDDFGGTFEDFVAAIHPDDREETVGRIMAAAGGGDTFHVRHRIVRPDGERRWVEGRGALELDGDGQLVHGSGVVYDITEQQAVASELAEMAETVRLAQDESASSRRRMRSLVEADAVLAGTLNRERLAARLADFVVQNIADLAVVDVISEAVDPELLTVVRADAAGREVLSVANWRKAPRALERTRSLPSEPVRVARTDRAVGWWAADDDRQQKLIDAAVGDIVSLPLTARGKLLGRLTAVRRRTWSDGGIELLGAVARRASTAIDQAEFYTERSRVAGAFRRTLVPAELPQPNGLDVAVEYRPLHELAQLGGDFYDVFELPGGGVALAVGDVCGKGVPAAMLAAPARHSLRAGALAGAGPGEALRILNRALLLEGSERFVTATMAQLRNTAAGTDVRVASAGHPAPYVLRVDGSVEAVPQRGQLLGVLEDVRMAEEQVQLAPGDALVMYTDGITDARSGTALFGEARFERALADVAGLPAASICQAAGIALDSWAGPGVVGDDVVVLVARRQP